MRSSREKEAFEVTRNGWQEKAGRKKKCFFSMDRLSIQKKVAIMHAPEAPALWGTDCRCILCSLLSEFSDGVLWLGQKRSRSTQSAGRLCASVKQMHVP